MPITLVATPECITPPTGPFVLKPVPTVPLYSTEPRTAQNPILYETISPSLTITAQSDGQICPPILFPNLITSVAIFPGQSPNSGTGCSIMGMSPIADGTVNNLPEYNLPVFDEPYMQYGSVAGPPSITKTLTTPLQGFYGEKYFYDSEYIYASFYKNSPEFDPISGKAPISPTRTNRLTSMNLLKGKQTINFSEIGSDVQQIGNDLFTGTGTPILLDDVMPDQLGDVATTGTDFLVGAINECSTWVKWRPSYIQTMKYYFCVVVTHTCPPFTTTFQGSMEVQNNWSPHGSRLEYYIQQQKGFLDVV